MKRAVPSSFPKPQLRPPVIVLLGFFLLILVGSLLLMMPCATRNGESCGLVTALFTSTSAVCVTGLTVVDTASFWSPVGQAILLLLIQMGGLGVVTISVLFALLTGRRIGLRQRVVMQSSIAAPQMGGIVRLTLFLFTAVSTIELTGALLLSLRFCPLYGPARGIWYALFHAVSAFCNAGFDLMGTVQRPFVSLTSYRFDVAVNLILMWLILVGGIGFFTYDDIRTHGRHLHRYHLQSKLILSSTAILLFLSTAFFFFLEFHRAPWGDLSEGHRFLLSLFQSVTPRTAGFNTVDLSQMAPPSQLFTCILMLIGGSPSSTAGGIKVTTAAVLVLCTYGTFTNHSELELFRRRLSPSVLHGSVAVLTLYLTLPVAAAFFLYYTEGVSLMAALFEACSALGTVGLTLGLTPELSTPSLCLLMALMYLGRAGALTLLYAVAQRHQAQPSHYPVEPITVG